MWAKRAYDFNMAVLVQFNGRKWIKSLETDPNWETLLEQAKQSDKAYKRSLRKTRNLAAQTFQKDPISTLLKILMSQLREEDISRKAFERTREEFWTDESLGLYETETRLWESIVGKVKRRLSSLAPDIEVTDEFIRGKLNDLQARRVFRVKHADLCSVEMAEQS